MEDIPLVYKAVAGVFAVLVILVILSFMGRPPPLNTTVQDLIREASQLHEISKQDNNAAISLQHATEALSYLSICRKLASDASILAHAKVSASDLERIFKDQQAGAIQKLGGGKESVSAILSGYVAL
jgi:hypothetical protein